MAIIIMIIFSKDDWMMCHSGKVSSLLFYVTELKEVFMTRGKGLLSGTKSINI